MAQTQVETCDTDTVQCVNEYLDIAGLNKYA
jgi:hypothetical protein